MEHRRRPVAERFWEKVTKTRTCWVWTAATSKGYGVFQLGRGQGTVKAHRWSWEAVYGPVPEGKFLCHTCDNPSCVRPTHLYLGDAATNMNDMISRGRSWMQQRQQCPQGHPYDEANTYRDSSGRRRCRACRRHRRRAKRESTGRWV